MTLGVFERIRERRRLAMAAAVAAKYKGIDLLVTPGGGSYQLPIIAAEMRLVTAATKPTKCTGSTLRHCLPDGTVTDVPRQ